jgi:hypothetical protein
MDQKSTTAMAAECRRMSRSEFVALPGLEYPLPGLGHVMALGLEEFVPADGPPLEFLRLIRRKGAVLVLAHPCQTESAPEPEVLRELDGIEVWNTRYDGACVPSPTALALFRKWRRIHPGLRAFQGADFHGLESAKPVFATIPPGPVTRDRVLQALRFGDLGARGRLIAIRSLADPGILTRAYIWMVFRGIGALRPLRNRLRNLGVNRDAD